MIEFINVTKIFGLTPALADVSFKIEKGCIGLLGPNGSGKTTSLKLISGQIKPSQGEVKVLDQNPFNNPSLLARIGYQPEFDQPFPWMSGYRYLKLVGELYGLKERQVEERLNELEEFLGLKGFLGRKIGGYSRGMRQRIKLAQALINDPEIVLLDEPLSGLDPFWRMKVLELIKELSRDNRIIVFSTHLLFDAEIVCKGIIFLYRGRVIARGSLNELRERLLDEGVTLKLILSGRIEEVVSSIYDVRGVQGLRSERVGDEWILRVYLNSIDAYYTILEILTENDFTIRGVEIPDLELDEIYSRVLRKIRGED